MRALIVKTADSSSFSKTWLNIIESICAFHGPPKFIILFYSLCCNSWSCLKKGGSIWLDRWWLIMHNRSVPSAQSRPCKARAPLSCLSILGQIKNNGRMRRKNLHNCASHFSFLLIFICARRFSEEYAIFKTDQLTAAILRITRHCGSQSYSRIELLRLFQFPCTLIMMIFSWLLLVLYRRSVTPWADH